MSIAFSRSTGALQADSHRIALITLLVAIPLIVIWIGWFLLATIAMREISSQLVPGRLGEVNAIFTAGSGANIQQGQDALLRLVDEFGQERIVPATARELYANTAIRVGKKSGCYSDTKAAGSNVTGWVWYCSG